MYLHPEGTPCVAMSQHRDKGLGRDYAHDLLHRSRNRYFKTHYSHQVIEYERPKMIQGRFLGMRQAGIQEVSLPLSRVAARMHAYSCSSLYAHMLHTNAHTTQARACTRAHKRIDALIGCIHVYLCICRLSVCTNVRMKSVVVHILKFFKMINFIYMFM